jgi:hypothetical protein
MTAVMRAVAPTGPKVLRIGLVQGGRVIEERIIKQRGHVTVGPSEKNMFVIVAANIPSSFRLFELIGGEYFLNFVDGMGGRIALASGVTDLSALKAQARRSSQNYHQVRLSEDARGKISIGDTTFLFQFVAPPPVQPKPQLPVAVTRGASSMDWPTTIIAAFSFLLHFLAIGALYSDWLDPIVDEEINVASLIDSMKSLPPAPPVEEQPVETDDKAETKGEEKAETKAAKGPASKDAGKMSAREVAALSSDLEQLEMATLGALASTGPATAGVLRGGEVPTGALDQAAASGAGVGVEGGGLRLGGGGGTIRPGEAGGGLGTIGATGRASGATGTGQAAKVKGPKGSATVGGATVQGGTISNPAAVVARMRAGFRACYQRGLDSNPDAQGRIQLSLRVGAGGEVLSVTASPSGSLPPAVVDCVKSRAKNAQFEPPQGGSAVVVVPVTFVNQ